MTEDQEPADELLRLLKRFRKMGPDSDRTDTAKAIAAATVELRKQYTTQAGDPDWKGATAAYKSQVRELYAAAGIDRTAQASAFGSIAYHVGNRLREILSDEELDRLGLRKDTPRERHTRRRATNAALLTALRESVERDAPDPLRALSHASALVERVARDGLAELNDSEVVTAGTLADSIVERGEAILAERNRRVHGAGEA